MRGISILDFDCCDVREDELRHLPHCACVRRTRVYRNHIYPASERGMRKCVKIRSKSGQKRVNAFIITYKSMLPQIGEKLIDKERMSSSILIPATSKKQDSITVLLFLYMLLSQTSRSMPKATVLHR